MGELPLLEPMLAVGAEPFDSPDHLYEVKWDGYRALAYLDQKTTLRSRRLIDLTGKFPELAGIHGRVGRMPAILDGEIVVFADGKPSFARLQARGRMAANGGLKSSEPALPAVFMAFDVLYAGGGPVLNLPLVERKRVLEGMVTPGDGIMLSEYVLEEGIAFYQACVGQELEGAVAKRLDGVYLPGRRSGSWRKFRYTREADLVICGFQPGRTGRSLGSLALCGGRDGTLVYQGKVGTGLSEREAQALLEALRKIEVPGPAFDVPRDAAKDVRWVRPLLVCSVQYLTTTKEGFLRHPVYRGLRFDKTPAECPAQGPP